MDPVYLVPTLRAKLYDGTNAEEISAWTGYEIVDVTDECVQLLVAADEVTWIPNGYWVFASITDPPTFAGVTSDAEMRTRYAVFPGTVTAPPPLDGEPVTP